MIFFRGINKHLLIFSKTTKLHPLYGLLQFSGAYSFQIALEIT